VDKQDDHDGMSLGAVLLDWCVAFWRLLFMSAFSLLLALLDRGLRVGFFC
jgi:hypothetical protein